MARRPLGTGRSPPSPCSWTGALGIWAVTAVEQRAEGPACGPTRVPVPFLTAGTSDGSYDTALMVGCQWTRHQRSPQGRALLEGPRLSVVGPGSLRGRAWGVSCVVSVLLHSPSANGPSWGRTRRQGRAGVWQAAGGWEGMWLFIWRGWAVPPGEFRRSEASEAVREV